MQRVRILSRRSFVVEPTEPVLQECARCESLEDERDVWRERYDDTKNTLDVFVEQVDWLRSQLAEKDAAMLAMRREGFDPQRAGAVQQRAPAQPLPFEVQRVIESLAKPGDALWHELQRDARVGLAAEGANPKEVAAELQRGSTLNPFHA